MSKPKHHIRQEVCSSRAPYREGRKPTAVKVYTIHHESKYLLIQGVPAVGARDQLVKLFEAHGELEDDRILDDYPADQFTEVYLVKYKRIQSARFAKKKLDDWSFFGGVLHVCYAPEYETVQETREKLIDRRKAVGAKSRQYKADGTYSGVLSKAVHQERHVHERTETEHAVARLSSSDENYVSKTYVGNQTTENEESIEEHRQDTSVGAESTGMQDTGVYEHSEQGVVHSALITNFYGANAAMAHRLSNQEPVTVSRDMPTLHRQLPESRNQQFTNDIQYSYSTGHKYGGQSGSSNTLKRYGEEVVQQANSLQIYCRQSIVNQNGINTRNTVSLKRSHVAENSLENSTSDQNNIPGVTVSTEQQLVLPPPPKQVKTSNYVFRNSQKHGGRKVPSAQATFPQDFDARTFKQEPKVRETSPENSYKPKDIDKFPREIKWEKKTVEQKTEKTMQEKIEENLKSTNPVIKPFSSNKTAVPRFIPRQAQLKTKAWKVENVKKSEDNGDELSKKIRKNALTLGRTQGPADLGPSLPNEKLDPKEKSVIDTLVQIRKKMTEV